MFCWSFPSATFSCCWFVGLTSVLSFLTKKHALLVREGIAFGSYSICTVTKCHPISFAVFVWNLVRNTNYPVPLAAIDAHNTASTVFDRWCYVISITPILKCVLYLHWWWRLLAVDWQWYAYPSTVWFTWLDFVECFSYPRKEFAVTIFIFCGLPWPVWNIV